LIGGQLLAGPTGGVSWWWLGPAVAAGVLASLWRPGRLCRALGALALTGVLAVVGIRQGARALRPACAPDAPCGLTLPGKAVIEGWVATDPLPQRDDLRFDFDVAGVRQREGWRPLRGRVRLRVPDRREDWRVGDCLRVEASLRAPRNFGNPGAFDYVGYLHNRGIDVTGSVWPEHAIERCERRQAWPRAWIAAARGEVSAAITAAVPGEAGGVLRALVIGDRSGVSQETQAAFSRAGVAHVLSISGLHFAVVAGSVFAALRGLFARHRGILAQGLAPRLAAGSAVPVALCYAALAGAQIPTLRAALMIGVCFGGVMGARRSEVLRSLALAALILSAWWPGTALEATFALSFVAVMGVVLGLRCLGPRQVPARGDDRAQRSRATVTRVIHRARHAVHGSLAVSIGAGLATAPLTALHFNTVSLIGPAANLVVVPLLSGATVVALVGVTAGTLNEVAGAVVLRFGALLANAGAYVAVLAAGVPSAAVRVVTPTALELGVVYALLACVVGWRRAWARRLAAMVAVVAIVDAGYWLRERYARPSLRVTFLDVGQGDATVVEFPGSAVLLVDGGGFPRTDFDPGQAIVARYLWARKIGRVDFVAMSHADLDHAGGLGFLVGEFRPKEFWWNGHWEGGDTLRGIIDAVTAAGSGHRVLDGTVPGWRVGPVVMTALHPAPAPRGPVQTSGARPCTAGGPMRSASCDTRDARDASRGNRNNNSLVLRLEWGATSVLFTGDIEAAAERDLLALPESMLRSGVLKVPHHGSRTSSGAGLLAAVDPAVAIISVGAGNRYGLPAPEVRRRYHDRGIAVLRTDECGAVTIEGDLRGFQVTPSCPEASTAPAPVR
jgi:competence protein ComEC